MPAVLHTQLSEAINRIALLSASFMQAVMFFFVRLLPLYSQFVLILHVLYCVFHYYSICQYSCGAIQGATAFNPLLRHHTGWNSNFTFLFCAAAAPHRVQQQK
jgi:hypothetical protein